MALFLPTGRNMVILPRLRARRSGQAGRSLDPTWPSKDPADTDIYGADWSWVFDGQAPESVDAVVVPAGAVTLMDQGILGTAFGAQIAGGGRMT